VAAAPADETVVVTEVPFTVAVIVADWSESIVPMLTKNVAEVALAATITAEGTVNRKGALLESGTTVLLENALAKVRVHAMLVFEVTMDGVH
jgi:hypothetical protein